MNTYFMFLDSNNINNFFGLESENFNMFAFIFGILVIVLWFIVLFLGINALKKHFGQN